MPIFTNDRVERNSGEMRYSAKVVRAWGVAPSALRIAFRPASVAFGSLQPGPRESDHSAYTPILAEGQGFGTEPQPYFMKSRQVGDADQTTSAVRPEPEGNDEPERTFQVTPKHGCQPPF